tara:strand:- start:359 stop:748 length:390 start_codon:yes stop_codon:yes gene_type:complete
MIINSDQIDKFNQEIKNINYNLSESKKTISEEVSIRILDINNNIHNLLSKIEELNVELNRQRIIISKDAENILDEHEKRNCIIDHFLPSMTLYSVMQNESNYKKKVFESTIEHKALNNELNEYNKYDNN